MSIIKHSWPRRSGKTGAAVMTAMQRGWKYYNCGGCLWTSRQFNGGISPTLIASSLNGLKCVVVDNYEVATDEDLTLISLMQDVEIFGTFGPDADDYRIPSSEKWLLILKDVDSGLISMDMALTEFNITPKRA